MKFRRVRKAVAKSNYCSCGWYF